MDAEALKMILDLQHKVTMYKRALSDLVIISGGTNLPDINYHLECDDQSSISIIADSLRSKQEK